MIQKVLIAIIILGVVVAGARLAVRPSIEALCINCNVVMVLVDTLSENELTPDTAPFISTFKERAFDFERAYTHSPRTSVSYASPFAGIYPWEVDMWTAFDTLPGESVTLAEVLQSRKYKTILFQATHSGLTFNLEQGFDFVEPSIANEPFNNVEHITEETVAWLNNYDPKDSPFYLFVGMTFNPPKNKREENISRIDTSFEVLMQAIRSKELDENTIIIFTATHGFDTNEQGVPGFTSSVLTDRTLHIPLIVYIPGHESAYIPYSAELRSLPATILETLGISPHRTMADSLLPLALKEGVGDRIVRANVLENKDTTISLNEVGNLDIRRSTEKQRVRHASLKGQWLLVRENDGTFSLFNTENDPEGLNDLYPRRTSLPREVQQLVHSLSLSGFSY